MCLNYGCQQDYFSVEMVKHDSTDKHVNALSPSFTVISVLCSVVVNLLNHHEKNR